MVYDWGAFPIGGVVGGLNNPTEGSPRPRLSRPELFMSVAALYGQRSSCSRAQVGVTATREGRIVASGYVGAPHGQPHCLDVGCELGPDGGCIRSVHAEANMIAWAARTGTPLEGTDVWCTHSPCLACAKLLINAGIQSFRYDAVYREAAGLHLLLSNEIDVHRI